MQADSLEQRTHEEHVNLANIVDGSENGEKDAQYSTTISQQIEMIKPQTLRILNIENKGKNT
jgi:hypothetical protein